MKKAPSHDIFDLIKSFDKGEKRNFKLLAGGASNDAAKQYLVLFDMIERQDVYDEEKLQIHFKDTYGGQFAVAKNYLFNALLKSLSQSDNQPASGIAAMRTQIGKLLDKELFEIADKLLKKAMREAEYLEAFHELYQLIDLQIETNMRRRNISWEVLEELQLRKAETLALISNIESYRNLRQRMNNAIRAIGLDLGQGEEFRHSIWRGIQADPLLQSIDQARSYTAKFDYYVITHRLADLLQLPASQNVSSQLDELVAQRPWLKDMDPMFFIRNLMQECSLPIINGRFEEASEKIDLLEQALRQDFPSKKNTKSMVLWFRLLLGFYSGDIDPAIAALEDTEKGYAAVKPKVKVALDTMILYFVAQLFFMRGDIRQALKWNNQCLNSASDEHRMIYFLSRLLNLLIHFSLENHSVVESEVNSLRRYAVKHGLMSEYEALLFKGLDKMLSQMSTAERHQTMKTLLKSIQAVVEMDPSARKKEEGLRVCLWLKAVMADKSVAEMLRA